MPKRSRTNSDASTLIYSQGSQTATASRRRYRRMLSRTARGYKLYKTPSIPLYPFKRSCRVVFPVNTLTGFIGGFTDRQIAWSFALDEVTVWYVNVAASQSFTIPGVADFTGLFDFWRLNRVDMKMIWQSNGNEYQTAGQTLIAPLIHVVTDKDDTGLFSLNDLLQYPNHRAIQLGQVNNMGPIHTVIKPGVQIESQTDLLSPLPSTTRYSPWCDTAVSNVKHNGIKISWDDFDFSTSQLNGRIEFLFDLYFEFKNPR